MSAIFKTKCPECDHVTSEFKDSTLTSDRTEYDGKRCKHCTGKGKKNYPGRGYRKFATKKTQALITSRFNFSHY
jgi:hypothetical protein